MKHDALSYFKGYRRKCGGKWYRYTDYASAYVCSSYWTQDYKEELFVFGNMLILDDVEDYT